MFWFIISLLIIGLIAGFVARLLVPGPDPKIMRANESTTAAASARYLSCRTPAVRILIIDMPKHATAPSSTPCV